MPTETVLRAFEEWIEVSVRAGATAVAHLAPGLSAAELDELEARRGFHLTEDARALWGKHNGAVSQDADGAIVVGTRHEGNGREVAVRHDVLLRGVAVVPR